VSEIVGFIVNFEKLIFGVIKVGNIVVCVVVATLLLHSCIPFSKKIFSN